MKIALEKIYDNFSFLKQHEREMCRAHVEEEVCSGLSKDLNLCRERERERDYLTAWNFRGVLRTKTHAREVICCFSKEFPKKIVDSNLMDFSPLGRTLGSLEKFSFNDGVILFIFRKQGMLLTSKNFTTSSLVG